MGYIDSGMVRKSCIRLCSRVTYLFKIPAALLRIQMHREYCLRIAFQAPPLTGHVSLLERYESMQHVFALQMNYREGLIGAKKLPCCPESFIENLPNIIAFYKA